MVRTVLFLFVSVAIFLLMLSNKEQVVQIQYPFGPPAQFIPLYLLILGAFLAGFLLAFFFIFPSWLRLKLENRRRKKEVDGLEEEIGKLRTRQNPLSPPASASSETGGEQHQEG